MSYRTDKITEPDSPCAGKKKIAGRWVRWNQERAARAYDLGLWVDHTLADVLRRAAEETPQRVLLIDGDDRVDCDTLYTQATALAKRMMARAPAGSVVSYMLPNWHEAGVIYLAATLAGMIANPILPSLRDRELQFILKDVDCRILFIPSSFRQFSFLEMVNRIGGNLPRAPEVIVLRGAAGSHASYEELLQATDERTQWPAIHPDAIRMVLYTSGTTGKPKGVLHTHNSIHALICQVRDNWLVERGDTFLVPSPIGHITGSFCAFECPLLLGTTAILSEQWNADEAVRLVDSARCSHFIGATPFLQQLLAAAIRANTRLPSLKLFACGGASVPPGLVRDAVAQFERAAVTRVYGSTEVPLVTVGVTNRDDAEHAAATDGRADLSEIKLVEHSAASAGHGEIYARGPQMLVGYLNSADEAEAFDADGYFRTGDIARWVDGDYLSVTGRAKDIIIRNGENISPKEIEDILAVHPDILEIAIVGLPDARTGERACAVVVAKGAPGPDVASLRRFLDIQGVAAFKVPEQVVIWDALPKNDAGKILKHQIRASILLQTQ